MDTEQSGEFVEASDCPQQETVIQNDIESKVETPVSTNGEGEHVNGHTGGEIENGVCTELLDEKEEDDAKAEENEPQEVSNAEPVSCQSEKPEVEENENKEVENDQVEQQEQQEKPVEIPEPEPEPIPEPVIVPEKVEIQCPEESLVVKAEAPKEMEQMKEKASETDTKKEEVKAGAEGEEQKTQSKEEKGEKSETEVTATSTAVVEGETSEVKEQEVDPTPATGSLAFAILEQDKTKEVLKTMRTMIVLRGLPGSGKSFLARKIAENYKDQCAVLCADEHDVKPNSADGYKAFDEAVVAKCSANTAPVVIVVDDTDHTHDRLARLRGIASEHQLVIMFLEPRTEWSRDAVQLSKKTKKGLEQAKLEAMKKVLEEASIPLYFGWFLFYTGQDKIKETAVSFFKALEGLEIFKKHKSDFEEKEVDLEQYLKTKGILHCTAKYTNYGKAEGAKEYTEKQVVQDLYGSVSELSLSALFVTPRTIGARVSLSDDQVQLWPEDGEKEAEPVVPGASTLPQGSRAHVTLGCADGVEAVQTGYDLLQILLIQKDGPQGEQVDIDQGTVTYYGEGKWYLALKEPISAVACFSSVYKPKSPGLVKKEKRKPKCTIL